MLRYLLDSAIDNSASLENPRVVVCGFIFIEKLQLYDRMISGHPRRPALCGKQLLTVALRSTRRGGGHVASAAKEAGIEVPTWGWAPRVLARAA